MPSVGLEERARRKRARAVIARWNHGLALGDLPLWSPSIRAALTRARIMLARLCLRCARLVMSAAERIMAFAERLLAA